MGMIKRLFWWMGSVSALLLVGIGLSSCDSTPSDGGGNGATYNLVVVLEKNLDLGQDIIWVQFYKDDVAMPNGVVVIDGDTVTTSSASGRGSKTYSVPRWQHNEKIQIAAIDLTEPFVYRDSVVIPDEFEIENILPANRIWRPTDGNAQVSWRTSVGAVNYAVSVRARSLATSSVGYGEYSESQTALSQVIPPGAFKTATDNLVEDVYDFTIIAYSPNFVVRRNFPPYKTPVSDDVRTPIINDNVDGGIAALVVSVHDTLLVQTQ